MFEKAKIITIRDQFFPLLHRKWNIYQKVRYGVCYIKQHFPPYSMISQCSIFQFFAFSHLNFPILFISKPIQFKIKHFALPSPWFFNFVHFQLIIELSNSKFLASPQLCFSTFVFFKLLNSNSNILSFLHLDILNFMGFFSNKLPLHTKVLVRIYPVVWDKNGNKQTHLSDCFFFYFS